jgi:superfamily II DNA or RNA helicase
MPTSKKKPIIDDNDLVFKNTKAKGDAYENYILAYLQSEDSSRKLWLWNNIPEDVMCDVGLIGNWNEHRKCKKTNRINKLPDVGCDIFMITSNNEKYLIQCKYYASSNSVKLEDLAGIFSMMFSYPEMNGSVYYTSKLSENIKCLKRNPRMKYYFRSYEAIIIQTDIPSKKPEIILDIDNPFTLFTLKPYDYQLDAFNSLKGKQRTILQLPCGMGKTLISIMLASHYNLVIFISPLIAFCQQNQERFSKELPEYNSIIVDSEGIGDIKILEELLSRDGKCALFVTYKSVIKIMELWDYVKGGFFIIDEFHNIPYDDAICYDDELDEEYTSSSSSSPNESEDVSDDDETESTFASSYSNDSASEIDNEEVANRNEDRPMYKLLHSEARILFMSATPRLFEESDETAEGMDIDTDIFGDVDYSFPMGKAITDGYICDYIIYVPTMTIKKDEGLDDVIEELDVKDYNRELLIKARFIIRGCLGTGSRKCIIYCADQKECDLMTAIIKDLCEQYFAIDCYCNNITSRDKKTRRIVKHNEFIKSKVAAFMCTVDIWNECVDIPECDSIFITYASKSKVRNIQRLCRANRIDKKNPSKVANIFLWCYEYNEMASFMKHIKEYDSRFTYEMVKRLNTGDARGSSVMKANCEENDGLSLKNIIVGFKGVSTWMENLEKVKKYIDENSKRPSSEDKNKDVKYLGLWILRQIAHYNKKLQIMTNKDIYDKWNDFISSLEYSKYFVSNEEEWNKNLDKVKQYIDENGTKPSRNSINKENKTLGIWISTQTKNYNKKTEIMKNQEIYCKWKDFINDKKYTKYFLSGENKWYNNLELVKIYIDKNGKNPSRTSINKDVKYLGLWISSQSINYNRKLQIMKNQEIYDKWTAFINNPLYSKYFISNEEEWNNNLDKVKQYINENGKRPLQTDKNKDIKCLGKWVSTQVTNYNKKFKIMKTLDIYDKWTEFINSPLYLKYFLSNEEEWNNNLDKVKKYIDENKKRPSNHDKNKDVKCLGRWIQTQTKNYKNKYQIMTNKDIYDKWTEFINNQDYSKYFE